MRGHRGTFEVQGLDGKVQPHTPLHASSRRVEGRNGDYALSQGSELNLVYER